MRPCTTAETIASRPRENPDLGLVARSTSDAVVHESQATFDTIEAAAALRALRCVARHALVPEKRSVRPPAPVHSTETNTVERWPRGAARGDTGRSAQPLVTRRVSAPSLPPSSGHIVAIGSSLTKDHRSLGSVPATRRCRCATAIQSPTAFDAASHSRDGPVTSPREPAAAACIALAFSSAVARVVLQERAKPSGCQRYSRRMPFGRELTGLPGPAHVLVVWAGQPPRRRTDSTTSRFER